MGRPIVLFGGAQHYILVLPMVGYHVHLRQIIGGTIPPSQNFVRPFHYHSQVLSSIESIPPVQETSHSISKLLLSTLKPPHDFIKL